MRGIVTRGKIKWMRFQYLGETVQESCHTSDYRTACRMLQEKKAEILAKHRAGDKASMKLSYAIEKAWEEHWQYKADNPRQRLEHILSIIGDKKLKDISGPDIGKIRTTLRKRGLKPSSVNRYMSNLKTLLKMARFEWEVECSVPVIKLDREEEHRIRVFTRQEEAQIIRILRQKAREPSSHGKKANSYLEAVDMIRLMIDTGMRTGEILNITPQHVDLEKKHIYITPDIAKSRKARYIPLTRRAHKILARKLRTQERKLYQDIGRLYPYESKYLGHLFRKIRSWLGIEDNQFVPHTLRHTFASRLADKGAPLIVCKELMGHRDYKTTLRYTHLFSSKLREAIDLLNN